MERLVDIDTVYDCLTVCLSVSPQQSSLRDTANHSNKEDTSRSPLQTDQIFQCARQKTRSPLAKCGDQSVKPSLCLPHALSHQSLNSLVLGPSYSYQLLVPWWLTSCLSLSTKLYSSCPQFNLFNLQISLLFNPSVLVEMFYVLFL